jgi:MoaD family protein
MNKDRDMAVTVKIPTVFRDLVRGRAEVSASGETVGGVLSDLDSRHPGLRERLSDDNGLRQAVSIFLNGEDVRFIKGLKTPVRDGDELSIVTALAGG